ncbi:hypothetical protein SAZ11_51120 [Streptomyces sp. FXJ1.4098]|nr:hypothetical protein [Streptomyces sp. FXJ1.4098]
MPVEDQRQFGLGTFSSESSRTAIGSPSVTTRQGCDLKNSSGRSAS